jgi:hypothetical protein
MRSVNFLVNELPHIVRGPSAIALACQSVGNVPGAAPLLGKVRESKQHARLANRPGGAAQETVHDDVRFAARGIGLKRAIPDIADV